MVSNPRSLSCGIVLFSEQEEVFLAHATHQRHWDIMKGGPDAGESPRETALREALEETGLDFSRLALADLGEVAYRPDKLLHLFALKVERASIDRDACHCSSYFESERDGRRIPEMDAFAWFAFSELPVHCGKNLARVLGDLIADRLFDALPLQRYA